MKKFKLRVLFFCCCFSIVSNAQSQEGKNFFYSTVKGNSFIAVEKVITHIAPSIGAAIDDSLTFGTPINILLLVPFSESLHGIEVPWAKCIYKKGEFNKVTFILASDLALASSKNTHSLSMLSFNYGDADSLYFSIKINNASNSINYNKKIGFARNTSIDSLKVQLINPYKLSTVAQIFDFQIFSKESKHSFNFIECNLNNNVLALEKASLNLANGKQTGNIWEFPSTRRLKKNCIGLVSYPTSSLKNATIKIYKLKNCSLQ